MEKSLTKSTSHWPSDASVHGGPLSTVGRKFAGAYARGRLSSHELDMKLWKGRADSGGAHHRVEGRQGGVVWPSDDNEHRQRYELWWDGDSGAGKEIWGCKKFQRGMGGVSLPFIGLGAVRWRGRWGESTGGGGFNGGQLQKMEEEAVGDRFRNGKMRGWARLGSAEQEATRWHVASVCSGAAAGNRAVASQSWW
jgi:hypothetical protein